MVVFCTYCGRSFTRDEHLDRHIRIHTEVKPFKCLKCHLGFSRSDLLERHMRFHDRDFVSNYPLALSGKSKGPRTRIACQNCAASKTKCDTLYPCKRCTSKNLECVLRRPQRAGRKRPIPKKTLEVEKKTSKSKQDAGKPIPRQFDDYKTNVHKPFDPIDNGYESCSLQTAEERNTLCGTPDLGLSNFTPNQSEGVINLEAILSTEQLPNIFDNIEELTVDSIRTLFGENNPDHSNFQVRNTPNCDKIDFSSEFAPLPSMNTPIQNEDEGKDFILFDEQEDRCEIQPFTSNIVKKHYSDTSGSSIAGASIIDILFRLRDNVCWLPDSDEKKDFERQSGRNFTDDLPTDLLDTSQEILVKILRTILDALSRFDSEILLSSPHVDNYSESIFKSLSGMEHDVLNTLAQVFVSGFDQMFPLLEQCVSGNSLSESNTFLSNLFDIAIITQSISCLPCSDTVSKFSKDTLDGCRTSILRTIKDEPSSGNVETVLHLCLVHMYHLLWVSSEESIDNSLENYEVYLRKIKNTYLGGHGKIIQEQSIPLPLEASELVWKKWKVFEKKRRLLYCWVIFELEVSLLYNRRPWFEVSDLIVPLPDTEDMWHASSAFQWSDAMLHRYPETQNSLASSLRPASLVEVFQSFVDDSYLSSSQATSIWGLRLLLYPLHKMVDNCNQLRKNFIESAPSSPSLPRTRFFTHIQALLEETRALLEKWHQIAKTYLLRNPECPVIRTSLVLYHILFLETLAYYPFVRRVCQQHISRGTEKSILVSPVQIALSTSNNQGLEHCVSILNIFQDITIIKRPKWWPLAIARAGSTLWTMDHCAKTDVWSCNRSLFPKDTGKVWFNARAPEDGVSRCRESMDPVVHDVLKQCVRMLSEDTVSPEVQEKREEIIRLLII